MGTLFLLLSRKKTLLDGNRAASLQFLSHIDPISRGGNMHRLLTFMCVCVLSGAMAFGQGTGQAPPSGTQSSANSTSAVPNSNGTSPSGPQGQAIQAPSSPNQALPGNSSPANATGRDAQANGKAVRPNGANGGTPGTAAGSANNPPDNSDNNGMAKDDTGNNPASGRGSNTITNPGTGGARQWFWLALGIIVALVVIGALVGRNRATVNIDQNDPALRATRDRDDIDRRDDQMRRAG